MCHWAQKEVKLLHKQKKNKQNKQKLKKNAACLTANDANYDDFPAYWKYLYLFCLLLIFFGRNVLHTC